MRHPESMCLGFKHLQGYKEHYKIKEEVLGRTT
jgi:hypothetical protein